ncbi:hypothetical protein ACERK3_06525 [Phycisphaerales bacterium AB-hyl4]|uniref:Uncharacterized protein n=1 Tax=Natronomicrosphaera hydrolytica TaxID=3242702 RepID=A0ABV4U342_9BACT
MLKLNGMGMTAVAVVALLVVTASHPRVAAADERNRDGMDQGVEALVELNYYVHEDVANVVFDLGHEPRPARVRVRAAVADAGVEVEEALAESGPTVLELPLADLPEGESRVALSVLVGNRAVWEGEDRLVKLPPPNGDVRITQIDRYRRIMLVDGEPLFPMGVFGVYPEYLQDIADAGFNMTLRWKGKTTANRWDLDQPWDSDYNRYSAVRDYLDAIHDAGLFAVETPTKLAPGQLYHRYRDMEWPEKYPVHNEQITPGVVRNARDHPAVIGYYSYDEPDNFWQDNPEHPHHLMMQEGVEEWYQIVKALDPYHAVMVLFAVGLSKNAHWDAWEVPMRDFYIYRRQHMSRVYDVARSDVKVSWEKNEPFVYTPLFEKSSGRPIPLSPEEQRAQTYLSLAADVKGLFYWDWPAAYGPNWEMLKQMAGEVEALSPILLERSPAQDVRYERPDTEKSVKVLVKNHDGRSYLLVVSAEPAPVEVEYRLPSRFHGEAMAWFDDDQVSLSQGVFREQLEPFARRVYELPGGEWEAGEALSLAIEVGEVEEKLDPIFEPTVENLIANSRFDYDYARLPGWPAAWHTIDSLMESGSAGTEDGRWAPVTETAVHGERSMRLIKDAPGMAGSTEAFNLLVTPAIHQSVRYPEGGTYTLSVWLRADHPARVWVMHGWAHKQIENVGNDWQRYEVTFEQGSEGGSFIRIMLMSEGTLWIDGVQLEKGDQASEYKYLEPTGYEHVGPEE